MGSELIVNQLPTPGILLELDCPIRALARVATAVRDSPELVLAVGTNQKALKLGKVQK